MAASVVGAAAAASAQTVRVLESDPPAPPMLGVELALDEPLYLRIAYTSDSPLRFQAKGVRVGAEVTSGERVNPAPVYPAGSGEGVVWVAYASPTWIDELRLEVFDERWKKTSEQRVRIDASWRPGLARGQRPRAAWVAPLNAAQQRMTSQSMRAAGAAGGLLEDLLWAFAPLVGLTIPGYVVLQIMVWRRWSGWWRMAALVPLIVTLPIAGYSLLALVAGSNLWPLLMIFTFPFAFAYLAAVATAKRVLAPES